MDFIVTCGCSDTDKFAEDAFRLLFPNHPLPRILRVEDAVSGTADFSIARQQLKALQKAKTKYAYYYNFDNDETWDLLKGVRIA